MYMCKFAYVWNKKKTHRVAKEEFHSVTLL